MSRDEHDDMRHRRPALSDWETALRQPRRRANWIGPVLLSLFVLFALFRAGEWWLTQRIEQDATGALPSAASPTARTPLGPKPRQASPAHSAPQPITKCVARGGRASYSDSPCPSGEQASNILVQPNLNLADGMSPQARAAFAQSNREAVVALRRMEQQQAAATVSASHHRSTECVALDDAVKGWDAMARHPQTGQTQDWIREQRKAARDRRFRLRCR